MTTKAKAVPQRRSEEVGLEFFVRSLAPNQCYPQQQAIVQRLRRLETEGTITEFGLDVWGDQIAGSRNVQSERHSRYRTRLAAFRDWAEAHDMSLRPGFQAETIHSEFTGETVTRIRLPIMTLAEYDGGNHRFVSPSSDGDSHFSVTDHIAAIENPSEDSIPTRDEEGDGR